MKTFILLCAIPGSGKSTWAEQYRLTHPHTLIVSSDALRLELGGRVQNFEHESEVWDLYFKRIIEYRDKYDDVTVIADSTNIQNKFRLFYGQNVTGFDEKILVIIKKPIEVALENNKKRSINRVVPEEAIRSMYERFEEPTPEVLSYYDKYVRIDKWFDSPNVKDEFHYDV